MKALARERISSMDRIHRRAACYKASRLSDDNASPVATLGQAEVHCLELVISTPYVDS
jgi:hypothetical protein